MIAVFNKMTIRAKLGILIGLFGVGLCGVATNDYLTLENVKVGGTLYQRSLEDQALLADILPPPLFVTEANLTAHEMLQTSDPAAVRTFRDRVKRQHDEFEARRTYWQTHLEEGLMKHNLLSVAAPSGQEFFELYDRDFVPAIERGDREAAAKVLNGPMEKAYERHHDAIEATVAGGNARLTTDDQTALSAARSGAQRLIVANVVLFATVLVFALYLLKRVTTGMKRSVELMRDVSEGEGDLTRRLDESGGDELAELAHWFNKFIEKIHNIMDELRSVADEVASASRQLSSSAEDISDGAQQTAASLEETAASLEEITSTVKQTADNAQRATELARASATVAEKGGTIVHSTVSAMGEIASSSSKIGEISGTIDEIAFQTNLLALNAAVEAARAGDQGRGFAVVAGEVRSLAQRSAEAAREIKALIGTSAHFVETGRRQADQSGDALSEIVGSVKRVTDVVAEIAAAAREQRVGVEQVNTAVGNVDRVTQSAAARTEEMAATAELLASQAAQVTALVGRFKLGSSAPAAAARAPSPQPASSERRIKARAPQLHVVSGERKSAFKSTGTNDFESF